ncbi:hypothetical protein ABTY20_30890 [Streptomyces sp. NPDC126497]|uniref:hypothetical protein n=1 Tax=Streptomyces sp. NPDC126497 TaxID=3155313 RepID=UPI0033299570
MRDAGRPLLPRRRKAVEAVARLHRKVRRQRLDHAHKTALDRDRRSILVHSDPHPVAGCQNLQKRQLGDRVVLPEPVGIEFDTEEFKPYMA